MNFFRFFMPVIILMIVGFSILFFMGYMHEVVHKDIFYRYGVDSEIEMWRYFPDWATVPEEPCPNELCWQNHIINDAVGYHLFPVYCFILFFSILLLGEIMFMSHYLRNIERRLEDGK